MLKSLAVWIVLLFLRSCGRRIDKSKISKYNKNHAKSRRGTISRQVTGHSRSAPRAMSYDKTKNTSNQVLLYSKNGQIRKITTTLPGRKYNYA